MNARQIAVVAMFAAATAMTPAALTAKESRSGKPTVYAGAFGSLWFHSMAKESTATSSNEREMDFSGGTTFVFEGYVIPYLTIGVLADVTGFAPASHTSVDDVIPLVSVDFNARALYPFGPGRRLEVYLRFAAGYTAIIPSRTALDSWQDMDDAHDGWNVRVLPGFSFRTRAGFTMSFELGWAGVGFEEPRTGGAVHKLYHSPAFNVGLGWTF